MPRENKESAEDREDATLSEVQKHVAKVWKRARSNAFAHRAAAEYYKRKAERYFNAQIIFGIFAILFVLLVFVATSTEILRFDYTELVAVGLTFLSVSFSVIGLYFSIRQNYSGYERLHQNHNHNQHSYLYLAQRAREVAFPEISADRAEAILEDLERDFQMLKARGQEPSDKDFHAGNKLLYEIKTMPEGELQSYTLDDVDTNDDPAP